MNTLYNLGDVIGKYLCQFKIYSLNNIYWIVISRFLFFFTFLMISYKKNNSFFQNDIFAYVNILIFAITNGYSTGGIMYTGHLKAKTP